MRIKKPAYKYKVLKEDKDDYRNSVIEKSGIKATFTVVELESLKRQVEKQLKEAIAQYNLEAAKMENIDRNHPFVTELTDEQRFTVHMYQEAKNKYETFKKFADRAESDLKQYEVEMKDMYEQLGLTPTPYGENLS